MKRVLCLVMLASCKFESPDQAADDTPGEPTDPELPATCEGIPVAGVCEDGAVARCVDGEIERESCELGCEITDGTAACTPLDCSTVGPLGRCDGEVLARCDQDPGVTTDCAAAGQSCGYVDDVTGYGCVDTASLPAKRITGTIRWEDRPLSPGQLGAPVVLPARGVMVAILDDATDATLATVSTADDGSYVAHYEATGNVRVVAYSRSRAEARPARVRDAAGYLHALGSAPFVAGATTPVDLTITATMAIAGAWNTLDNAVTAMDWIRARGTATLSPVFMYWQLGSSTGSYYQGADNSLHLDGDDGWDDVVALHELGHYMQDEYSVSDNPGGAHDGSPADPRLAWGEGGATWFAIAIRGMPAYIDYSAGGGWSVELENRVHAASMSSGMSQRISEWMVAEVMFDIGDGAGGDDDVMTTGTQPQVWDVLAGYMTSNQMMSRGFSGVDLVEFLDGWFMTHGMTSCDAMQSLLVDHYKFPYDFAGPAGACP
jgi:hypothetical protein